MSVRLGGSYDSYSLRPTHLGRAVVRACSRSLAALRSVLASSSTERESSRRRRRVLR